MPGTLLEQWGHKDLTLFIICQEKGEVFLSKTKIKLPSGSFTL